MPMLLENPSPLRQLRDSAGLTAEEVAEQLRLRLNEKERSYSSIIQMERRGIEKYDIINALAEIYSVDPADVAAAASASKKQFAKCHINP